MVAAFVVPHLHLGDRHAADQRTPDRFETFADTAPIFGWWNAHVGWGTIPAILIGIAAVLWGPTLAQRLRLAGADVGDVGDVLRVGASRWR